MIFDKCLKDCSLRESSFGNQFDDHWLMAEIFFELERDNYSLELNRTTLAINRRGEKQLWRRGTYRMLFFSQWIFLGIRWSTTYKTSLTCFLIHPSKDGSRRTRGKFQEDIFPRNDIDHFVLVFEMTWCSSSERIHQRIKSFFVKVKEIVFFHWRKNHFSFHITSLPSRSRF